MIKFVHTADIHFGMENYGKIDPKTGIHTRLLDFHKAFIYCIDTAIENNVDFFLFSGDAYKTSTPTPTQQRLLWDGFIKLFKANIPVIIIVGNHDNSSTFGKSHALELFGQVPLEGFYVVSKPQIINLKTKNGPVQIVGIPWPSKNNVTLQEAYAGKSSTDITKHISNAVSQLIKDFASELDPKLPAILAGHLTVASGIFSGSERRAIYGSDPIFSPSELAIEPFDYIALGHLHRYQNLNEDGFAPIIYPGSIERIDFGERNEEKGFCIVEINNKMVNYDFIKTPTRNLIQIETKIIDPENQTEELIKEIKKHDIKDAIVKILYHLPENSRDSVNISKIQEALKQSHYITGIIPIKILEKRISRANLKVNMQLKELLEIYFRTKPELKDNTQELIEKTLKLEEDLQE